MSLAYPKKLPKPTRRKRGLTYEIRVRVPPQARGEEFKGTHGGVIIANNGFDKERANKTLAEGRADLIAFGTPFIANPDLVVRLFLNAPLLPVNRETLYGGGEHGYTDYPFLRSVAPHACYRDTERAWG